MFKLPTQAQWERAARGTDGRRYPWGNVQPNSSMANYGSGKTEAVNSYTDWASPYGLLNMAGNVEEWIEKASPGDGYSLAMGGSYISSANNITTTSVEKYPAWESSNTVGFRLCMVVER